MKILIVSLLIFSSLNIYAAEATTQASTASPATGKVKFKKAKDMSFDSQLVEGLIYRPDLSVVTGDTDLLTQGILRMRHDFKDRLALENGEESK